MKLNQNIESYDINSLQGIEEGVKKMKNHCEQLCQLGELLKNKIQKAKDGGFQDINMIRTEELINEYLKKMRNAESEYLELSNSVKEYIEKIHKIWSAW